MKSNISNKYDARIKLLSCARIGNRVKFPSEDCKCIFRIVGKFNSTNKNLPGAYFDLEHVENTCDTHEIIGQDYNIQIKNIEALIMNWG